MMKKLFLPKDSDKFNTLHAGETVYLSGEIFVARDQAHKRICKLIEENKPLPFSLKGATIYYAGPCPTPKGVPAWSVGPTSSYRMDAFAPILIENGAIGMIGKGDRNDEVLSAIKKFGAVYFAAIGGAGALYANRVKESELIAFPELLSEAVYRYVVEDFPVVVAIDSTGKSIY